MKNEEIVKWLRSKKVETGSLLCLGCGHEHNCGIHGCAVMRAAADAMENLQTENAALRRQIDSLTDAQAVMVKEFNKKLEELCAYKSTGLEPEDVRRLQKDWTSLIMTIDEMGGMPHLCELYEAEKEGRLVVLPFMLHSTMLNLSDPENLEVMKDVSLYVAWKSSSGIVFHSPYNCFLQDIEKGYIKADSEEAEAALKGGEG